MRRIFDMYVHDRLGARAIATTLTDDGVPCPSAHDPERNRHRAGNAAAWSRSAIRAILTNPRYTGFEVWGKAKGDEDLLDPDDTRRGYIKKSKQVDRSEWIWSSEPVHEAIVEPDVFAAASEQIHHGRSRRTDRRPATKHTYVLRGRLWCATCARKMSGDSSGGSARYRCRLTTNEYARNAELDITHPKSAAVSERRATRAIDGWLERLFDADNIETTIAALIDGDEGPTDAQVARADRARKTIASTDAKLDRYRQLLDHGTAEVATISEWMREVQAERAEAERELADATPTADNTADDIAELVTWFADNIDQFRTAMNDTDPAVRQALYDALNIVGRYTPGTSRLELAYGPTAGTVVRVGGGT